MAFAGGLPLQHVVHSVRRTALSSSTCRLSGKGLRMNSAPRVDGDITGTILRLDTELSGAWSSEGTKGAGQRSKEWFQQQEQERLRKVNSVRVRHILVSTSDLALQLMDQLRTFKTDFADLAAQISNCESSRNEGGNVGWVSEADSFLDDVLPLAARQAALSKKPGTQFTTQLPFFTSTKVQILTLAELLFLQET